MGKALELLTGIATAPDTTLTALTMAGGNSLTIRNAVAGSQIKLLQIWIDSQTGEAARVRSPLLHDNVEGIRLQHVASQVDPLLPWGPYQTLIAQDTLVAELAGSSTAADIETLCMLVLYDDLPGVDGRFIDQTQLESQIKHIVTVENSLALGTAGNYSGEEALNAEFDLLKGNTDYAILGFHASVECACVRYRSSDWGNLGIGGPGNDLDKQITARWFQRITRRVGTPLIPVFNSANVANVLIDGAQDENGTDSIITTILAELA